MNKINLKNQHKKKLIGIILKKKILSIFIIIFSILLAIYLGIDNKIIVFFTIVFGVFTEIFIGFGMLIGAIPFIGPFIIKIISIPIFWILNAMGYVISAIAIKKGYSTELAKSRILTLALLIGIIIGYITGNLIPLR